MKRSIASLALGTGLSLALVAPAFAAPAAGKSATFNSGCVVTALSARKASLDSALSSQKSAVNTREDALISAWSISDVSQREAALKSARDAYRGSWKGFLKTMKDTRQTFRTALKACNVNPSSMESSAGTSLSNGF